MKSFALDTGPIVALLNRRDSFHEWARDELDSLEPPLFTCEAVLSEACFLLRHIASGPDAVLALVDRGILRVDFRLADHVSALRKLLSKYKSVPMSLADACLVRMADIDAGLSIVTIDSDFHIYRRMGRHPIPLVAP